MARVDDKLYELYAAALAPFLANEESLGAVTATELAERLGARIPSQTDRSKFLSAVRALGR